MFIVICFYYCVMFSFVSLRILIVMYVPFCVFSLNVLFCVLHYCHDVSTQLQLKINNANRYHKRSRPSGLCLGTLILLDLTTVNGYFKIAVR
jgi:hypothetical protein